MSDSNHTRIFYRLLYFVNQKKNRKKSIFCKKQVLRSFKISKIKKMKDEAFILHTLVCPCNRNAVWSLAGSCCYDFQTPDWGFLAQDRIGFFAKKTIISSPSPQQYLLQILFFSLFIRKQKRAYSNVQPVETIIESTIVIINYN